TREGVSRGRRRGRPRTLQTSSSAFSFTLARHSPTPDGEVPWVRASCLGDLQNEEIRDASPRKGREGAKRQARNQGELRQQGVRRGHRLLRRQEPMWRRAARAATGRDAAGMRGGDQAESRRNWTARGRDFAPGQLARITHAGNNSSGVEMISVVTDVAGRRSALRLPFALPALVVFGSLLGCGGGAAAAAAAAAAAGVPELAEGSVRRARRDGLCRVLQQPVPSVSSRAFSRPGNPASNAAGALDGTHPAQIFAAGRVRRAAAAAAAGQSAPVDRALAAPDGPVHARRVEPVLPRVHLRRLPRQQLRRPRRHKQLRTPFGKVHGPRRPGRPLAARLQREQLDEGPRQHSRLRLRRHRPRLLCAAARAELPLRPQVPADRGDHLRPEGPVRLRHGPALPGIRLRRQPVPEHFPGRRDAGDAGQGRLRGRVFQVGFFFRLRGTRDRTF
ncbi:MAG: hypothetical protein BJ554DRAFT_5222, partial [Olpidium bornovanus]